MKRVLAKYSENAGGGDALLLVVAMSISSSKWLPAKHPRVIQEIGEECKVFSQSFSTFFKQPDNNRETCYIYTVFRNTRRDLPYSYIASQRDPVKAAYPVVECAQYPWTDHGTISQGALSMAAETAKHHTVGQPLYLRHASHILGPFIRESSGSYRAATDDQVFYWHQDTVVALTIGNDDAYIDSSTLPPSTKVYYCFSPGRVLTWYKKQFTTAHQLTVSPQEVLQLITAETSQSVAYLAKELSAYLELIQLPERVLIELIQSPKLNPAVLERIVYKSADQIQKFFHSRSKDKEALHIDLLSPKNQQPSADRQLVHECHGEIDRMKREHQQLATEIANLKTKEKSIQRRTAQMNEELTAILKKKDHIAQEADELAQMVVELNREYGQGSTSPYTDFSRITEVSTAPRSTKQRELEHAIYNYAMDRLGKELSVGDDFTDPAASTLVRALKQSRCILTPQTFVGQLLAGSTANAVYFHSATACDWLTFADFNRAIFRQAVTAALAEPDRFVFLQLTNFNNSSPSCYLLPVTQHMRGDTSTLPGGLSWPRNLWLILTPAQTSGPLASGLPIDEGVLRGVAITCNLAYKSLSEGGELYIDATFSPDIFPLRIPYFHTDQALSEYCYE